MVSIRQTQPAPVQLPPMRPRLRVIPGGRTSSTFQAPERTKVALRTFIHNGERELRGVAVRLDTNAVEVFGVGRGLHIGESVLVQLELARGERPVWLPACPHLVSPERTVLWFDRADAEDIGRVQKLLSDMWAGRARRDGLYTYFHADEQSLSLDRVSIAAPA